MDPCFLNITYKTPAGSPMCWITKRKSIVSGLFAKTILLLFVTWESVISHVLDIYEGPDQINKSLSKIDNYAIR